MSGRNFTFRRRVALAVALLVAVSLSLAGVGVWGVMRIHADSGRALKGYRQLREIYEVGVHVAQARQATQGAVALRELDRAMSSLNLYTSDQNQSTSGWLSETKATESQLRANLRAARETQEIEPLDRSLSNLATLASQVRSTVEAHQLSVERDRKVSLALIAAFSIAFLLLSVVIGVMHYRSVVHPVDQLARTVRRFAAGFLNDRVEPSGQIEFAQLARDLNHMADELQSLYRELEQKVEAKSRELVQSERLASVGYLAAGVAHEINNPLGIIAAYAERALQRIRRGPVDAASADSIQQAFTIICDEAFRCKEITDRLLTMARTTTEGRREVSIGALAQEVVAMLAGLPQYRHANLYLECDADREMLTAHVNDAEIKQVLLNLLVNAMEAIDTGQGKVEVRVMQSSDQKSVELTVSDTGRGMERDVLDRVFEPFYSQKRGVRPGTGLGLSICHAIIESHGGKLTAHSDGAGKGSRFTVTLPAVSLVREGEAPAEQRVQARLEPRPPARREIE